MKNLVIAFFVLSALCCPVCLPAEENFDYEKLERAGHPRLILDWSGFADLKQKISSAGGENEILKGLHNEVISHAARYLSKDAPVRHELEGKRMLSQSRMALMQIFSYAYVYRMTGNEKYALKVRDILRNVCTFPDWNPKHFLDTGEMALAVSIGYDWIYECLDEDDRSLVRQALKELVLEPSVGRGFRRAEGNWNSVCYCGCLAAALVLYEYEKPLCSNLMEDFLKDNRNALEAIYSPDGNYGEGCGYWGYGTSFQVVIFRMLKNIFGTAYGLDEVAGIDRTAQYMIFMTSATKRTFSYADGGEGIESPQIATWWLAADSGDLSLLCNELRLFKEGRYSGKIDRLFPFVPCVAKDIPLEETALPKPAAKLWSSVNKVPIVMVHTRWTFNQKDIYLGIKGGSACDCGHAHMDAGSFVYEADGYRWSDDYVRPNYFMVEREMDRIGGNFWTNWQKSLRWDVFKLNNLAHSTMSVMAPDGSVDKTHPSDHIAKGRAGILQVFDTDARRGAELDMTAPLADGVEKATRTIVLEKEKKLVITDAITAKSTMTAHLQWRMNTPAKPYLCKDGIYLQQDGKLMRLSVKSEKGYIIPVMQIFSTTRPADWTPRPWDKDLKNSLVGFEICVPAGESCTFTTTLAPASSRRLRGK